MDVRTICLGLLSAEDRSGYEIKKLLEEGPLGHFVEASFGSIYPALTKMTEDGLVEFRTEAQEGRPDKKTYSITERGREVFRTALEGALSPDRTDDHGVRREHQPAAIFPLCLGLCQWRALGGSDRKRRFSSRYAHHQPQGCLCVECLV